MDMITLAMAKAYTDEKCNSSGGSSGGGLTVVEITTQPSEAGTACTEAESAALAAAHETGLPVILKIRAFEATVVAGRDSEGFLFSLGTSVIAIYCDPDVDQWLAIMS